MEEFQYNPIVVLCVISVLSLNLILLFHKASTTKRNPPPSPPKLPIIGNLHQLTSHSLPHRALHSLAQKHGPIMLLHLGSVPVLVVSSPDSAREVMKTHDIAFASRPTFKASKKLLYNCKDVGSAPYGEYWRKIKSIFVLQLLSNKRVQSFRWIREEETALLVNKVRQASGALDLSAMFATFTNDGIARAAFGKKYSESENGKKFLRVMTDLMEFLGVINIGDFMPWLDWIGCVNGFYNRLDNTAKEMDDVLECLIQEHRHNPKEEHLHDFLDILIQICHQDASIQRHSIKPLLLDVFVGGTDTISTALEWVMSELLQNPRVMEKLQFEVRGITKQGQEIRDSDIEKMHYLKAVIKEAMRCHPPFPLLGPRIAREDVRVKGYDVAAGTMVMINGWAIGRDPASWDEPDKFIPERFLNSSIDLRGQDLELIPFGAGRRGCPGITFSIVAIEIVIANLVQNFDWKLPNGVDLDMNETPGMAAHRVVPLLALASPISE